MLRITIGRAGTGALRPALLDSMYRLRHRVFHERLRWAVRSEGGREHDWFDCIAPQYLVAHTSGEHARALGCCRLLPSQGPNMLRDVFGFLLDGDAAPEHPRVWEVSRFAIDEAPREHGFGFTSVPRAMLQALARHAFAHDVEALVGVTSAPVARMLAHLGFTVERLGRARRVGDVTTLAFRLPLDQRTLHAVCGPCEAGLPTAA